VEVVVVLGAQRRAHAHHELVTGHYGGQQVKAAGADPLGHRQRGRHHHRAGVRDRLALDIVHLDDVRQGAVDQRRHFHRAAFGQTQQRHLAGRLQARVFQKNASGIRADPGQGRTEPVQHQQAGGLDVGGGEAGLAPGQLPVGQALGEAGLKHGS
jgi:hypothetical protein